jgi:glycosyltransferase involved in cell wall biosynthesis
MEITVCITTKDRWKLLENALTSVINQKHISKVIVINDGSKERESTYFLDILKDNNHIVYIKNNNSIGLPAARNLAIQKCDTEIFTFLDDDDLWPHNFIFSNNIKNLFKSNRNLSCAFIFPINKFFGNNKNLFINIKSILELNYFPPVGSQFYLTEVLKKVGGYDETILSGVDHDLWIRLLSLNQDILCSVTSGYVAYSQTGLSANRMTTNEKKRFEGIRSSLTTWRPLLTKEISIDFYEKFEKSYFNHIKYKFFRKGCATLNLKMIIKYFSLKVIQMLLKDIFFRLFGLAPRKFLD